MVFDPPHLTGAKDTAWLVKKYGKLDDTWPQMLHDGFFECMRVLKPDGVLIFKWSEHDIPAQKVWDAIGQKPLFGHHSGKKNGTFWGCFMKIEEEGCPCCRNGEMIAWDVCGDGIVIETDGKLHMLSGGDWEAEIKYCPMCGRKLNGKTD